MLTKTLINKIFPFKVFPIPNTDFKKKLSRWHTDIDEKKINNRAIEDHCRVCEKPLDKTTYQKK